MSGIDVNINAILHYANPMWFVAQAAVKSAFSYSHVAFWAGSGVAFCLIEMLLPKSLGKRYRFVALILGITALIVAVLVWRAQRMAGFNWQIVYWMGLSTACVIWVRPMLLKGKGSSTVVPDAMEAKTLTEILPGQIGRVIYEGTSWQATCEGSAGAIPPYQKVYVLRREGNTLIVVPENLFHP